MQEPPIPANEAERLAALRAYEVLDTEPEQAFDDLTLIASKVFGTPIALVSLVDAGRQWFKSRIGLNAWQTPRRLAFCAHAIARPDEALVVPDALEDGRFADNPLVADEPGIRLYAGMPLVAEEGLAVGTLCVIDLQPREVAEEQLDVLAALGRQVVAQLDLRRRNLEFARLAGRLAEANEALTRRGDEILRFYHTLAHELKTPLTAAREFVCIVNDGLAGAFTCEQRDHLGTVRDCCDRIRRIVDDLLDMTRLETGKLSMDRSRCDIAAIIEHVVTSGASLATGKKLAVHTTAPPDLPPAWGDADRLSQVVSNLLGNAIKFTPEGGRIDVTAEPTDDASAVAVSVRDTGIGIPEDQVERIFDRLYQVRREDSEIGGLGLGLPLCREIVRQHGGTLTVTSEQGAGSTFTFTIPIWSERRVRDAACREVRA